MCGCVRQMSNVLPFTDGFPTFKQPISPFFVHTNGARFGDYCFELGISDPFVNNVLIKYQNEVYRESAVFDFTMRALAATEHYIYAVSEDYDEDSDVRTQEVHVFDYALNHLTAIPLDVWALSLIAANDRYVLTIDPQSRSAIWFEVGLKGLEFHTATVPFEVESLHRYKKDLELHMSILPCEVDGVHRYEEDTFICTTANGEIKVFYLLSHSPTLYLSLCLNLSLSSGNRHCPLAALFALLPRQIAS